MIGAGAGTPSQPLKGAVKMPSRLARVNTVVHAGFPVSVSGAIMGQVRRALTPCYPALYASAAGRGTPEIKVLEGSDRMSRLDEAAARLEAAIERLDTAAHHAVELSSRSVELQTELDAAKKEYAELSKVTDEVSEKLDKTIGRLKFVLEG